MENFKVSFVLPAFKRAFLDRAIASILNQTYDNFELIIVDDASPEDLESVVRTFDDHRIRFYRNATNIGGKNLVRQWNHCLQYASGDYIVLAADDDLYDPDFLLSCVTLAVTYPEVDLIRARVMLIDEQDNLIGIDGSIPVYSSKHAYLFYWLRATILTCIGNYMFKSTAIKEKQFIDFPSAFCSDAATAISLAENGVANTSEMLFKFRISSIHLSSSKAHLGKKLAANTQFYQWLSDLGYEVPDDAVERFFFKENNPAYIHAKGVYDYYNQVIKFLPWYKFYYINYCTLLSNKEKLVMFGRFWFNKLLRRY